MIHVKDASEDVRILGELNSAHREDFLRNLRTEQQRLREEFVRKESGKTYRTLAEARARALRIDTSRIARPARTGRFVFADYPLDEIAKLINWSYFFAGWGLAGRYPPCWTTRSKAKKPANCSLTRRSYYSKSSTTNG